MWDVGCGTWDVGFGMWDIVDLNGLGKLGDMEEGT